MKTLLFTLLALFLFSAVSFSQTQTTWTVTEYERPDTRIGWIGNVWHPLGVLANYEFDDTWGVYGTAKANIERHEKPMVNQMNYTGGMSVRAFRGTSQILVGFSYITEADYQAYNDSHPHHDIGLELLLITQFVDKNWNVVLGWYSNPLEWSEGYSLGFLYQW
jgi:hypothetical protein